MLRPLPLLLFLLLTLVARATGLPPYVSEALARFSPNLPPDWAYTITTLRGGEISVERFDPSLPVEKQWTLLVLNQRPPTPEENSRYTSYRISTSRSTQPTFLRSDIDLPSLRLLREDDTRAEFHGRFREGLEDPMLKNLELFLTIAKQPAAIEKFSIQLTEPYSPVLTVKMLELRVETSLLPPLPDRPDLPQRVTSRFRGRVLLFKSIEEDVESAYADFVQVRLPPRPTAP
jgi:hypothetical protein